MIIKNLLLLSIFLVEGVIAWFYLSYIFEPETAPKYLILGFTVGYVLLFLLSKLNSMLINNTVFFLVNGAIIYFCFSKKPKDIFLQAGFLAIIMLLSEIITDAFVSMVGKNYDVYRNSFYALFTFFVLSRLIYLLIAIIFSRVFKPHRTEHEDAKQTALLALMPVISIIIVICFIYVGSTYNLTEFNEILMTVSIISLLLIDLVALFVYKRMRCLDNENLLLKIGQSKDSANAEYYSLLEKQFSRQQILIHDIKNHLTVIDSMADKGEYSRLKEYISTITAMPEFSRNAKLCDNPILNIILLRYSEYCDENGIAFNCDVRADSISFMDATCITALFGNLLSNAVEAAEHSRGKSVDVSVTKNSPLGLVLITVVNSSDSAPKEGLNGIYKSTKANGEHGYGIKSIRQIVERYNGNLEMNYDESAGEFHSIISFSQV